MSASSPFFFFFSPHARGRQTLAYTNHQNFLFSADQNGMMGTMMQDLAFAIPGVDEAMSFAEIMKYVTTTLLRAPPSSHIWWPYRFL